MFSPLSVCLSVCYLQNGRFFKYIDQSILLFCLSCLSVNRLITILNRSSWNFNNCTGSLNWEGYWCWDQRSFWGQISKIVNFHRIDMGFEGVAYLVIEFNHKLFLRSNLFYVFCKYILYTTSYFCKLLESFGFRQLCWSIECVGSLK